MLSGYLKADLNSCFSDLVLLARRNDLVAIARESGLFRIHYNAKFDLDSVDFIKTLDTVLIIVRGKVSKSTLSVAERDTLLQYIRESNASLN